MEYEDETNQVKYVTRIIIIAGRIDEEPSSSLEFKVNLELAKGWRRLFSISTYGPPSTSCMAVLQFNGPESEWTK